MPDETSPGSLGDRIKLAMFLAKKTQQDVADHLGLSQASVSARLAGRTSWRVDELQKVATFLGVPVTDLVAVAA